MPPKKGTKKDSKKAGKGAPGKEDETVDEGETTEQPVATETKSESKLPCLNHDCSAKKSDEVVKSYPTPASTSKGDLGNKVIVSPVFHP
jgi:hypothetical protein